MKAGYRRYMKLAPGAYFRTATPEQYLELYGEQLEALDPRKVADELQEMAGEGKVATMLCFETVRAIGAGSTWCHRHIAARWLEDRLGVQIEEVGAPVGFDPWRHIRKQGIEPPRFSAP